MTSFDFTWKMLSAREQEVATLILKGMTNAEMAGVLYLSINTIKVHVRNVLRKFNLARKADLIALALAEKETHR